MRNIRPSLIFSLGDRAGRIARQVQNLADDQYPELAPVRAFVNLGTDGRLVWRINDKEERELTVFEGLSPTPGPGVFRENYNCLVDDCFDSIERVLKDLTTHIRRRDELARIRIDHGLKDSNRTFVYLIADTFGAVSSTFPLALVRLISERGLGLATGVPVSFNTVFFLPELFEEGRNDEALLRTHWTLSELERFLSIEEGTSLQSISWKTWIVGSMDRKGGAVEDVDSVMLPVAQFLGRYIDGALDRDESWTNELGREVNQRRMFLSSFGYASLHFPRGFLEQQALQAGQCKVAERLVPMDCTFDEDEIAGEVQSWVRRTKLQSLTEHLRRPQKGKLITRDPQPPKILAKQLFPDSFEKQVRDRAAEDPEWGIGVQRAGRVQHDRILSEIKDELGRQVDSKRGLEGGRLFAKHLTGVGTGITEATVGLETLNLEGMILRLQSFFAEEAGIEGNPARLIELGNLIPGKIAAMERLAARLVTAEERFDSLSSSAQAATDDEARQGRTEERSKQENEDATVDPENAELDNEDQEDSELGVIADHDSQGHESEPLRFEDEVWDDGEPETSSDYEDYELESEPPTLGNASAAESLNVARDRLENVKNDLAQLEKETDELREEREKERELIVESRRLACDPASRHILLQNLLEKESVARQEEHANLVKAVTRRNKSNSLIRQAVSQLKQSLMKYGVLLPSMAVIVTLLVYMGVVRKLPWVSTSWVWPLKWISLTLIAVGVVGLFVFIKRWFSVREARSDLVSALQKVTHQAECMWRGHLEELKKRFEFLINAEAITVFEKLQEDVLKEQSRVSRLQKLLEGYKESTIRPTSERKDEDSLYNMAVPDQNTAQLMVKNDPEITHAIRVNVERLTLSDVLESFRRQTQNEELPGLVAKTEEEIQAKSKEILKRQQLSSAIEATLRKDPTRLRNVWDSIQAAAAAWVMVAGDPPAGVLKKLIFHPRDLSQTFIEENLGREVEDKDQVEWIPLDNLDHLSVCEMYVGFPTHLVNEIRRPDSALESSGEEYSVDPSTPLLSCLPARIYTQPDDELDYALLQAALNHCRSGQGLDITNLTANEQVSYFLRADFLPQETIEQLLDELEQMSRADSKKSELLSAYLTSLKGRYKSEALRLFGDFI